MSLSTRMAINQYYPALRRLCAFLDIMSWLAPAIQRTCGPCNHALQLRTPITGEVGPVPPWEPINGPVGRAVASDRPQRHSTPSTLNLLQGIRQSGGVLSTGTASPRLLCPSRRNGPCSFISISTRVPRSSAPALFRTRSSTPTHCLRPPSRTTRVAAIRVLLVRVITLTITALFGGGIAITITRVHRVMTHA